MFWKSFALILSLFSTAKIAKPRQLLIRCSLRFGNGDHNSVVNGGKGIHGGGNGDHNGVINGGKGIHGGKHANDRHGGKARKDGDSAAKSCAECHKKIFLA